MGEVGKEAKHPNWVFQCEFPGFHTIIARVSPRVVSDKRLAEMKGKIGMEGR
jgi:hypothetical protein